MCRTFGERPSRSLRLVDPSLCDDVDIFASELLREHDPDPLELMQAVMTRQMI
jgi:hypothetical protein